MDHAERLRDLRGQLDRAVDPANNPTAETLVRTVFGVIKQIDSALAYDFVPNYAPVLILPKKDK